MRPLSEKLRYLEYEIRLELSPFKPNDTITWTKGDEVYKGVVLSLDRGIGFKDYSNSSWMVRKINKDGLLSKDMVKVHLYDNPTKI